MNAKQSQLYEDSNMLMDEAVVSLKPRLATLFHVGA